MLPDTGRFLPFMAASAALHATALAVVGAERLSIGTAPAETGRGVAVRLVATGPPYVHGEAPAAGRVDADNTTELYAYALLDLRASRRFAPDWRSTFKISNATDEDYVLVETYNTDDRSFYVELSWRPGGDG